MTYLKVKWKHSNPEEPIWLYSELDDSRWEVRKIEIFPDGHYGFASATEASTDTGLGEVPVPPIGEIAAIPEFEPEAISKEEFEKVWSRRTIDRS
jgi:hypothetical protein